MKLRSELPDPDMQVAPRDEDVSHDERNAARPAGEDAADPLDGLRSSLPDPVMQAAPRALLRAAQRAREIARQTGTPLVIVRDGVLVYEDVSDTKPTA
jgi:F420-dependent methylenetetrahydromethanopterin dehydrogenase